MLSFGSSNRRRRVRATVAGAAAVFVLAGCTTATGVDEATPAKLSEGQLVPAESADAHQLREVPAEGAPSVELKVTEDPWGTGWTVQVATEDFEFAPQRLGQLRPQEGHVHLYLDGKKIARLYSPWYPLPASAVPAGEHELSVSLNANDDHARWAVDGEPIKASTTVDGSGDTADNHSHTHADGQEHDHDVPGWARAK